MTSFLSYEKIETFVSNLSFLTLFFSMIAYWIETSGILVKRTNFNQNKNPIVVSIGAAENSNNSGFTDFENKNFENSIFKFLNTKIISQIRMGAILMRIANFSLFFVLLLRFIESGHFPLSNLYESLMFLSWALTVFHLLLEKMASNTLTWIGSITSPTAFFTNAFANFSLPVEMQHSSALVPALQSNWLMMHVTVMILSYAALIFGSLLSIAFLILSISIKENELEKAFDRDASINSTLTLPSSKLKWVQNLDNLSYRMLGIGFPLLTIGILSGAVWANEAWGSYWSWDPKETWALLTWLVFAIYLHTRITKGWQGRKPAYIASFGFFVVWVCYLGVNLLGEGLHSYGWINS